MNKRRLITSALPYVNNVPHLGNLIQVLSADVFARFCRLRGYETLYVCGTDEYGTATETRAAEEGISPSALCERYFKIHDDIYRWFNIAFDIFGRSSTQVHTEVTQDIFQKLDAQGYISEKEIEQLYCESCKRFLADRYVLGSCPSCHSPNARGDQCEDCGKLLDPTDLKEPRCASCGQAPKLEKTRHLYIDLPQIRDKLEAWMQTASKEGFWAHNAIQMTQAWIRDGLRERGITRDLSWGIPVPKPGYEKKVFYVWFDAPIGYISMTGNLGEKLGKDWRSFVDHWWKSPEETELFQFIGKDNIPFHTVIFPSSLLGSADTWTMLHHMSSTEYMNYEGGKFSKSRGIGVFGDHAMETGIPADVWRFYIYYMRPEKADTLFTWKDFQEKVNGQLIGNVGNLVNRTLSFVSRYYEGKIPQGSSEIIPGMDEEAFWARIKSYEEKITGALERAELREAFHQIFELSSFANKTFQDAEPWKTRQGSEAEQASAAALIKNLCYVLRDLAILLQPYLPQGAESIASFFGLSFKEGPDDTDLVYRKGPGKLSWDDLGSHTGPLEFKESQILFNKLEDDLIAQLKERYSGNQKDGPAEGAQEGPVERFTKTLDLRAALISQVERHPKADKLYVVQVQTAAAPGGPTEERTIVSGLVPFYTEEELLGRRIILAYNLKAAKLRGVESRGMLLAAEDTRGSPDLEGGLRVEVLDPGDAPLGSRVQLELPEGSPPGEAPPDLPQEIDIDTFFSIPMKVEDHRVMVGDQALCIDRHVIKTHIIPQGEVH
ncbi:MAG: methionine--tRNA ligase [Treponema sp.]|nr:methionine--tRNA ligase [Treponema sp.]